MFHRIIPSLFSADYIFNVTVWRSFWRYATPKACDDIISSQAAAFVRILLLSICCFLSLHTQQFLSFGVKPGGQRQTPARCIGTGKKLVVSRPTPSFSQLYYFSRFLSIFYCDKISVFKTNQQIKTRRPRRKLGVAFWES